MPRSPGYECDMFPMRLVRLGEPTLMPRRFRHNFGVHPDKASSYYHYATLKTTGVCVQASRTKAPFHFHMLFGSRTKSDSARAVSYPT